MNKILLIPYLTPFRHCAAGLLLAVLVLAPIALESAGDDGTETQQLAGQGILDSLRAEDLAPLLERHRGKVVLVNFWATWCGPCIHEIPALLNLREKLDPSSFELVPISLDDPIDASWLVEEFIESGFPNWYSYLSGEAEDYLMVEELDPYWPGVLPANYLIGPDGTLAKTLLGGHTEEQFEAEVRALIAPSADAN